MPEKIIHLDSRNSDYLYDSNNTSKTSLNCFHTNFKLNEQFTKIKKISLMSLEMPIGFNNIRTGSTNYISFCLNGLIYNLAFNEVNYTSITTLILDMNTLFAQYLTLPVTLIMSLDSSNRIVLTISNLRPVTSFYVIDSPFTMYILGFRQSYDKLIDTVGETVNVTTVYNGISTTTHNTGFLSSTSTYYYRASTSTYNLNPDNFISMYIPQLSGCVLNMAGLNTTFKIPMNCVFGTTYFLQEHQNFKQIIEIRDKHLILNNITITMYDRFGNNIDNKGLDYSMSLLLEYEN